MSKQTKVLVSGAFVVVLIGALAGVHWLKGARESGLASSCMGNLKLIGSACAQYEAKHGTSAFHVTTNFQHLVDVLISEGFLHPAIPRHAWKCGHRYDYVFVADAKSRSRETSGVLPVLRDSEKNAHASKGINVLFSDGYVEWRKHVGDETKRQ